MLNSQKIKELLHNVMEPVVLNSPVSFKTSPLDSGALISSINGAIISYDISDETKTSINNLKMMCLLCKDRWSEDESHIDQQSTKCCYKYQWQIANGKNYETRIYTYEIEELHVAVGHLPESDLILLLISGKEYPYGLMILKMKHALQSFENLYGYKLS